MARREMQYADNQFPTDPAQLAAHGASLGAIAATMVGWIPAVVALIPAVYYLILIFESRTVQNWFAKHRARKARKKSNAQKQHHQDKS